MKCIIVDDEPIARIGMKRLVSAEPDLEALAYLDSAEAAARFLEANPVDLVLLDIRMPGLSGIDFARPLPARTLVIFTTAYSEYAVDSYELDAVDYLLKPVAPERFAKAVGRARAALALLGNASGEPAAPRASGGIITVRADRRFVRVRISDITRIEALKDYVIIHSSDSGRIITRMKIKDVEDLLPSGEFLRVNRSNIVRRSAVTSFDTNDIYLGDTPVAIGPTYRRQLLESLL